MSPLAPGADHSRRITPPEVAASSSGTRATNSTRHSVTFQIELGTGADSWPRLVMSRTGADPPGPSIFPSSSEPVIGRPPTAEAAWTADWPSSSGQYAAGAGEDARTARYSA